MSVAGREIVLGVSGGIAAYKAAALASLLPSVNVKRVESFDGPARTAKGRFKPFLASGLVEIEFTTGLDKLGIYGQVVRDLAADQVAWIRDPAHARRLTEADGAAAVAMACDADRMAMAGR